MRREMDRDFGGALSTGASLSHSPLGSSSRPGGTEASSTSYQSKSFSSSSSSSLGGGVPHHTSQSDSVYRSTRTGPGNIPHTSYSHTTASHDSERPYSGPALGAGCPTTP